MKVARVTHHRRRPAPHGGRVAVLPTVTYAPAPFLPDGRATFAPSTARRRSNLAAVVSQFPLLIHYHDGSFKYDLVIRTSYCSTIRKMCAIGIVGAIFRAPSQTERSLGGE